jgi:hypothetical protein
MNIIGKKNPRFRIAVADPDNRRSNIWRIAVRKNDVYVSTGGGAPAKFSFHESGICRDAFTGEFGAPPGMDDRVMKRWRRADIPAANTGRACSVLEIVIPTDFLSDGLEAPAKEICWVGAAAPGRSKSIEMFFSADTPDVAQPLMQKGQFEPQAAIRLDNGKWLYVTSCNIEFAGQEIRIPATGKRRFDFLIKRGNAGDTAPRVARILVMNNPADGDKLIVWEYGAFRCDPETEVSVDGTLTTQRIYHATSWGQ